MIRAVLEASKCHAKDSVHRDKRTKLMELTKISKILENPIKGHETELSMQEKESRNLGFKAPGACKR